MSQFSRPAPQLTIATAAGCALLAIGIPLALAAPPYDGQGYLDSTARCAAPDTMVFFGSTETSRVAICKSTDGTYAYRGVRVRDGAKLITSATPTGSGSFIASSEGVTYTVTSSSLTVAADEVIRTESMLDSHGSTASSGAGSTAPRSPTGTATQSTPTTETPTATPATPTMAEAPSTPATQSTRTALPYTPPPSPTPDKPLPPPLAAEVGGSSGSSS